MDAQLPGQGSTPPAPEGDRYADTCNFTGDHSGGGGVGSKKKRLTRTDSVSGGGNGSEGDVEPVKKPEEVQPVTRPNLKLVQPVARKKKRAAQPVAQAKKQPSGATGGTKGKLNDSDELQPPSIAGCEWRFTGYGWELWKRVPSVSESGKRSSKRTYLAYYSRDAVKRLHDAREKTTNARTA